MIATRCRAGLLAAAFTKAIPDLTESFNVFADGLKAAAEAKAEAAGE